MSNNNDSEWTVVGGRNKPRKNKPKKPKSQPQDQFNQQKRPTGPVSASFNQGSHFPGFNPRSNNRRGPTNKERTHHQHTADDARHLKKIEDETETFHHKKVSRDLSQKIINFRASHHLTQKQLAAKMSLPLSIVQGYERGTSIPVGRITNQFHQILNREM